MKLALAPMDGVTDSACRFITKKIFDTYNHDDSIFFVSEFMSADGFYANPVGVHHHLLHTDIEQPLIVQIFGSNIDTLIHTAKSLEKNYNFAGIELNIGCPSNKIMAIGGGSAMLKDKTKTLQIIKQLRKNIKGFFSIKTRAGLNNADKPAQKQFILAASDFCDMISVHGRTLDQQHSGDVDWDFIYDVKQHVGNKCEIIGNGGIKSYQESQEKLGNLDGIMIGQASIGNPWIFTAHEPDMQQLYDTIIQHLDMAISQEIYFGQVNDDNPKILKMPNQQDLDQCFAKKDAFKDRLRTPIEFRKHLFNYIKGLNGSKSFKQSLIKTRTYDELKTKIDNFWGK